MRHYIVYISLIGFGCVSAMDTVPCKEYPVGMTITPQKRRVYFSTGRSGDASRITITPNMIEKTYIWTPIKTRVKTKKPLDGATAAKLLQNGFAEGIEIHFYEPQTVVKNILRNSLMFFCDMHYSAGDPVV